MNKNETDTIIENFMHPTVYTGVEPLFLVAEELATKEHMGDIIDAVWVYWKNEDSKEFRYITKFAVPGEILDRNFYTKEELEPFKGRLALPHKDNFEKMIAHSAIKQEIKDVKAQRNALSHVIEKDFANLRKIVKEADEVFFFKKGYGDWIDPFYDINIEVPYQIVEYEDGTLEDGEYKLKHPTTGVIKRYVIEDEFYAYIIAGRADIAGLQLKDESYKTMISEMKDKARKVFTSIEWLSLNDPRVKAITEKLPRHPFENYFVYVEKGKEAKRYPPDNLVKALIGMIEKYMPKVKGPMGVEYIPVDNLLYLFHEIIPRAEALRALEACDIIHQPSALVLGYEGKHEIPPKFLVSVKHIASAYKKFPRFIEACEAYTSSH
ncbi:MAG: hypothetical protein COA44_12785 [Arcobacter sp.]|nr:MAG: hypothetical protein COA44_12785 [Arcobacter sp.]